MFGVGMGMGFWWIGGVIMMGLFIWLLVSLVNRTNNPNPPMTHHYQEESSLDILKKRYARGEITKEEFDRMSKDLK